MISMIRNLIKHLRCGGGENPNEGVSRQSRERKPFLMRIRSLRDRSSRNKNKLRKVDELELEWSNSPKSRLRRNGFDIPVYG